MCDSLLFLRTESAGQFFYLLVQLMGSVGLGIQELLSDTCVDWHYNVWNVLPVFKDVI